MSQSKWNCGFLLVPVLLVSGCTTTRLTGSWADDAHRGPFRDVLVIGIAKVHTNRLMFENIFAKKLEAAGVEAQPSYTLLPSEKKLDRQAIQNAVAQSGSDSILITRVLGKEEKSLYYPPSSRFGTTRYYGTMYGYYGWAYDYSYGAGYSRTYNVYTLESNLYDAKTGNLIWSATTETDEPDDMQAEISALVDILVNDLKSKGLLRPPG